MSPEFGRRQGGQVLRQGHQVADKASRSWAEGELHSFRRAKEIGDTREVGAIHLAKQECRTARGNDTTVNLGELKVGAHRDIDVDDLTLTAQQIEVGSETDHIRLGGESEALDETGRVKLRKPPMAVKLRQTTFLDMTKLLLLGTGTPAPMVHRAGSSYLVQSGDERLLFDCGPGSGRRLLEAGVNPAEIDHLFLTHLHYDHCVDFPYIVLARWDQGVGRISDLPVYGPAPLRRMSQRLFAEDGAFGPDLRARTEHPGSHYIYEARGGILPRRSPEPQITEVENGSRIESAGWSLDVAEVVHVQPQLTCLAYRLTTPDATIVFGGDTAPVATLTQLAKGADVLLHMCHFINGAVTDERLTCCCSGHLDAAQTAHDAGVRTLVLVHITSQLETPGVRERVLHEVAQVFDGQIIFGEDQLTVPLGGIDMEPVR